MLFDWWDYARCRDNPDEMFVQGAAQHQAKQICKECTVSPECLAEALDSGVEWGVWGGMTERERRAVLLRNPHVTSWRAVLDGARPPAPARRRPAAPPVSRETRDDSRST